MMALVTTPLPTMSDQTNRLEQALIELADGAISTRQDLQELTGAVRLLQQSTERMQSTIADNDVRYQTRFEQVQSSLQAQNEATQERFTEVMEAVELVSRAASEAVETNRANAERFETLRQDAIADRQAADQRHQDFIERFDNQQRQLDATLETMQTMLVELSRTNGRVEALESAA